MKLGMVELAEKRVESKEREIVNMLEYIAESLEDAAKDVRNYSSQIQECTGYGIEKEERLSWAVNGLENMIRNLNISTLVRLSAELAQARTEVKIFKGSK